MAEENQVKEFSPDTSGPLIFQQNNQPHLTSSSLSAFIHYPTLNSSIASSAQSEASLQSFILKQDPEKKQSQPNLIPEKFHETLESGLNHAQVASTQVQDQNIIKITSGAEQFKMEDEKIFESENLNKQEVPAEITFFCYFLKDFLKLYFKLLLFYK